MKIARNIVFGCLVSLTLAAAVWALPVSVTSGNAHLSFARQQPPPKRIGKELKATGKISSVQKDAFILDVTKPKKDSLALFMDDQTMVDGDLAVGATADVVYQMDDEGNFVANMVHVTP